MQSNRNGGAGRKEEATASDIERCQRSAVDFVDQRPWSLRQRIDLHLIDAGAADTHVVEGDRIICT
jgi:hypothetical protein